jgi:hypothetical protein
MPIVITDEDAMRLLSIPEAVEAMGVAFRDLALGRAVNPPRLRYSIATPRPKAALQRQYPCGRGRSLSGRLRPRRIELYGRRQRSQAEEPRASGHRKLDRDHPL